MLVANRFDDICDKISIVKSTRKRERERLRCYLSCMKRNINPSRYFRKRWKKFRIRNSRYYVTEKYYPSSRWLLLWALRVIMSKIILEEGEEAVRFSWKFLPFREELADNYRARGQPPSIRRCDCASSRRWNFARKRRRDRRRETHCSKKEKRGESNLHRFPVNPFLSRRGELSLLRRRDSSTLQRILQRIFVTRVYCNRCISLLHI